MDDWARTVQLRVRQLYWSLQNSQERTNFRLDLVSDGTKASRIVRIRAVFGNGRVGKYVNLTASTGTVTGAARVLRGAGSVDKGTKPIG